MFHIKGLDLLSQLVLKLPLSLSLDMELVLTQQNLLKLHDPHRIVGHKLLLVL